MARGRQTGYNPAVLRRGTWLLLGLLALLPGIAEAQGGALSPEAAASEASEGPPSARSDIPPSDEGSARNLEDLLAAAHRNYPSIDAAEHAVVAAEAQLDEARVSPFMQFTGTAAFTVVPSANGTPTYSDNSQLNLGGEWGPAGAAAIEGAVPLYTFGKIRNLRRAAREGVRAAEEQRRVTVRDLDLQVRRAFFGLQLALDIQQMIAEGLGKLEQAREQLEERLAESDPSVDPMDRYRIDAALAEVRARASQAQLLRRVSTAALATLTGLEGIAIPDCPSEPVALDPDAFDTHAEGLAEQRPETSMLDAAVSAHRARLDIDRARFFPDLVLALDASISWAPGRTNIENPFIQDAGNTRSLAAALVARWNLDLWGTHARVRQRRAELARTQARRREALAGMSLQARRAYEELLDARRRERAWGEGERATRSWFVAAGQAYQVGAVEPKQLIDAVKEYFSHRFNHLQAVHDFNVAAARLERATGGRLLSGAQWNTACRE